MLKGGCYCGEVRYEISADPVMSAECHCRPCQYISGGGPNYYMLVKPDAFAFTGGEPRQFRRSDLENPVTRHFCPTCGTHLMTRMPGVDFVILKAGSLDDPAAYGQPKMAICCAEMAPFHLVPEGIATFDGLPPRR
jgi:hypothetical protein